MDRISRHPILQKSQCTRIFLESTDFVSFFFFFCHLPITCSLLTIYYSLQKNDKRSQILSIPPTSSIFDSISDTLVNAFVKIKKPDEKFEEMKDSVSKFEDNLNTVERLYMRINKRQQGKLKVSLGKFLIISS